MNLTARFHWTPSSAARLRHVARLAAKRKVVERSEAHPAFRDLPIRTGRLK